MAHKVFVRTARTDWVEMGSFASYEEARALAKEFLNDVGVEVMTEEVSDSSLDVKAVMEKFEQLRDKFRGDT